MSTENEGNAVPAAPSVPPVPVAAPEGTPASAPGSGAHDTQDMRETPVSPEPYAAREAHEPAAAAGGQPGHSPQPEQPTAPLPGYVPAAYPAEAPADASAGVPAGVQQPGAGWPPSPPGPPSYGSGGSGGPAWGAPVPVPEPPRRRSGGLVAGVLVAALVAGGVGGGIGYWAAERNDDIGSTTVSAADAPRELKRDPGTVAAVAGKALPSVVTIEAKSGGGGIGEGDSEAEGGTGTGFVYDKEGHILTNNHVVASAAGGGTLSAIFSNGKKYDAEVVGRAQGYDVAVLKLKNAPSGLSPLPLGNSERVAVGDSTIAIGAPFGLSNTVTTGIISAKNRPVASGDGSSGKNSYMSALQTDASINPGNSGGPLLDGSGAVIGINSAIQSAGSGGFGQTQAGSIGLGFAIPINQAKNVAQQLIRTGQPVYPVIGATVDMAGKDAGAKIAAQAAGGSAAVVPNGPAAKAGLKAGDIITKFNGKPIDSGPTLISEIWTHKSGDKITLSYERDGVEKTAEVVLGERKGDS
ncbi:trypsin-like peptidase domain-containing protein [Streptomyces sp. NBC_01142]|uniref:S1C family serine protease n=1 Tax=Streptomyces sp. NBC_01142 TaxID=2975865 RepID=UPI002258FCE4|nr:trypsin-like peptidase domain-containing protein [Streptomyces sp. NBC_01142]MCX4824275.1 trypsin-like peptidase domain-containing protein [Streptomyces sp. NBC_01142]